VRKRLLRAFTQKTGYGTRVNQKRANGFQKWSIAHNPCTREGSMQGSSRFKPFPMLEGGDHLARAWLS